MAALSIGSVAGQVHASDNRSPAREDRHAIPALLAAPYRMIARLPDRLRWKFAVGGFEFLKTNQMPQFGPEDLFSPDPTRRQEVEDQWDAYVAAQKKSASLLHDSRERQAAILQNYRAALKISDIMKEFYWKVGKTPGTLVQYEYAKKAVELEAVSQNLGDVNMREL
jgi:hypothetical protein